MDKISGLEASLKLIENLKKKRRKIITESKEMHIMSEGPVDDDVKMPTENLYDIAGNVPVEKSAGLTIATSTGQQEVLNIQKFFARPIQISEFDITNSGFFSTVLSPWSLYSVNDTVRAKLRNFAYFRANLHIRIMIAGTPFHYGRLLISYQPFPTMNDTLQAYLDNRAITADTDQGYYNYLSQAPGAFTMDVKDNQPVEIILPYISPKPMHRLYNTGAAAIAAGANYDDMAAAGDLFIQGLTNIGSVADAFTPVQVYVYAWATEVELGAPTATIVGINTESGKYDERKQGPVEKIASRGAEVANALSVIPEIQPFAVASSIALSGLAKIASLFGWSRPILDQRPSFVKNLGYQPAAYTIGSETTLKLTLDPHQELTVDPRVCGSAEDELTLAHINSIESYLTAFPWADTDDVMVDPIFKCLVTPSLFTVGEHLLETFVQPTAMAFASQPFGYWRGNIKFRFDFVCSAFHRGKIAIFYEPNLYQNALINATVSPNKQFMKVIDLSQTQSVTFEVQWAAPRAWLKLENDREDVVKYGNNAWTMYTTADLYNGYIAVVPLTKLVSPDSSDISVLVFVSASDMHYNFLTDIRMPVRRKIVSESGKIVTESGLSPIQLDTLNLNESSAKLDHICQEHFGEEPLSFRSLLKRYQFRGTANTTTAAAGSFCSFTRDNIPVPLAPYSASPSGGGVRHLLDYLRYAYLGLRGSTRHRARIIKVMTNDINLQVMITNGEIEDFVGDASSNSTTVVMSNMKGSVHHHINNNAGIEWETPFYTNNLFVFSFHSTMSPTSSEIGTDVMEVGWVRRSVLSFNVDTNATYTLAFDIATGEDFSLLRFQGAPYYSFVT